MSVTFFSAEQGGCALFLFNGVLWGRIMQLSDLLAQHYQRLRKRRQQASCHSDIWSFCRCFAQRQASLQNQLLAGSLRLQPMLVVGRSIFI